MESEIKKPLTEKKETQAQKFFNNVQQFSLPMETTNIRPMLMEKLRDADKQPFNTKMLMLGGLAASLLFMTLLFPAIRQPSWQNNFADKNMHFLIPNFWNVVTNWPLAFVGILGLHFLLMDRSASYAHKHQWMSFFTMFLGLAFSAFGGSYYNFWPNNTNLFWERLPIMMTLMATLAITIKDRVDPSLGSKSLYPLLVVGIFGTMYWWASEWYGLFTGNNGDLRWYLFALSMPVMFIPAICLLFPQSRHSRDFNFFLYSAYASFMARFAFDMMDRLIYYSTLTFVSGHMLSNLSAVVGGYCMLGMLREWANSNKKSPSEKEPIRDQQPQRPTESVR